MQTSLQCNLLSSSAQKLRKPVDFENIASKKKPFANIWCEESEFLLHASRIGSKNQSNPLISHRYRQKSNNYCFLHLYYIHMQVHIFYMLYLHLCSRRDELMIKRSVANQYMQLKTFENVRFYLCIQVSHYCINSQRLLILYFNFKYNTNTPPCNRST